MAASADLVGNQRSGLTGSAAHFYEHLNIFPAFGAFYLHQPGRSFSLLAAFDQAHTITSRSLLYHILCCFAPLFLVYYSNKWEGVLVWKQENKSSMSY